MHFRLETLWLTATCSLHVLLIHIIYIYYYTYIEYFYSLMEICTFGTFTNKELPWYKISFLDNSRPLVIQGRYDRPHFGYIKKTWILRKFKLIKQQAEMVYFTHGIKNTWIHFYLTIKISIFHFVKFCFSSVLHQRFKKSLSHDASIYILF